LIKSPLLSLLALGTFAAGTSELILAGILPLIARDLEVSVALAGQLVTAYAVGFGLGAPVLVALTSRVPRRPLLLAFLLVFTVGSAGAALAPSYGALMVCRVIVALAAGAFEVVATATAAALVPPAQRGRAIALVVSGFSVSLVLGVPLGALVGDRLGWRATFVGIAILGTLVLAGCAWLLPPVKEAASQLSQLARLALVGRPAVLLGFTATWLLFTGQYVMGTYFAPFLQQVTGLDGTGVAAMLLVAGGASTAGNVLGGYGSDRWGAGRTATAGCLVLAFALALVPVVAANPVGAAATMALIGGSIGAFVPTWQHRLVSLVPQAADLALALNLTALNAGIAMGAAIGGLLVDGGSLATLGFPGASFVVLALVPMLVGLRQGPASQRPAVGQSPA
jgi:DHA1 family putative efflux transporter-like MFS transporter